jgi:hypothetical protein
MRSQLSAIIQRFAAWLTIGSGGLILLLIVVPGMIVNNLNNNLGSFSLGGLLADAYNNMIWEILGVAFTVLIIDKLYQTQQERQEKKELILRLQSRDSRMVAEAANVLRTRGWLAAGALCRTNLNKARLRGLNLRLADFSEADLKETSLDEADLAEANLKGTSLEQANLRGANLEAADFAGADLKEANLASARLGEATGLSEDQLSQAARLATAVMPDGQRYDGRFQLAGDLRDARLAGYDPNDPVSMARYYDIPLTTYQGGQMS